jgi:hypothetical protein
MHMHMRDGPGQRRGRAMRMRVQAPHVCAGLVPERRVDGSRSRARGEQRRRGQP